MFARDLVAWEHHQHHEATHGLHQAQSKRQDQVSNLASAFQSYYDPANHGGPATTATGAVSATAAVATASTVAVPSAVAAASSSSHQQPAESDIDSRNNNSSAGSDRRASTSVVCCPKCLYRFIPVEQPDAMPLEGAKTVQPSSASGPASTVCQPHKLTDEEMALLLQHVNEHRQVGRGLVNWPKVEEAFATAADDTQIFRRRKDRLVSSYNNLPINKKPRLQSTAAASGSSVSAAPSTTSAVPAATAVMEMSSASTANVAVASITAVESSVGSTSRFRSTNAVPVLVRSTSHTPFSVPEKEFIRSWGRNRVQHVPPLLVDAELLFCAHKREFEQTLGYIRKREELKEYWKNWWKDNKNK